MNKTFPNIPSLLATVDAVLAGSDARDITLQKISQLLADEVDHYHWVGFYIVDASGDNLILGPYVGDRKSVV